MDFRQLAGKEAALRDIKFSSLSSNLAANILHTTADLETKRDGNGSPV